MTQPALRLALRKGPYRARAAVENHCREKGAHPLQAGPAGGGDGGGHGDGGCRGAARDLALRLRHHHPRRRRRTLRHPRQPARVGRQLQSRQSRQSRTDRMRTKGGNDEGGLCDEASSHKAPGVCDDWGGGGPLRQRGPDERTCGAATTGGGSGRRRRRRSPPRRKSFRRPTRCRAPAPLPCLAGSPPCVRASPECYTGSLVPLVRENLVRCACKERSATTPAQAAEQCS